jgi:ParB family chromosome partitioning protein
MQTLALRAVDEGWSVRDMESRVKQPDASAVGESAPPATPRAARTLQVAADVRRVEDALRQRLATDVRVTQKRKGRGLVTISYYSNDDLARLLELLLGRPFDG